MQSSDFSCVPSPVSCSLHRMLPSARIHVWMLCPPSSRLHIPSYSSTSPHSVSTVPFHIVDAGLNGTDRHLTQELGFNVRKGWPVSGPLSLSGPPVSGTSVPMSGPVFACVRVPQCLTQALCQFPKKPMSESQHDLGEPDRGSKSAHVQSS